MSEKRLEEIKEMLDFHIDWASNTHYAEISDDELKEYRQFIIEKAERAEELELENKRHLKALGDHEAINKHLHDGRRDLRKQNKRYREAFANAGIEAIERGAMTLDEDMPDDKEKAYRLGALDMLEDFTDFYLRELGVGK